jgi:hypothetical protein
MNLIFQSPYQGENTVKGANGTKVKVIFQGLYMTHVVLCWFITLKFVFRVPLLTPHFTYKYILTTN